MSSLGHLPTTAVVLCGGRGSRLGALTSTRPKPMLPVQGTPILAHVIAALAVRGVERVVLPIGYLGDVIRGYAPGLARRLGVELVTVDTGVDTPIAARLGQVEHHLVGRGGFLLVNGDALFDLELEALAAHHAAAGAVVTLASVDLVSPFGLIHERDGLVVGFTRDETTTGVVVAGGTRASVNAGIAVLADEIFEHFDAAATENFEAEVYPRLIAARRLAHLHLPGFWYCIDTPRELERSQDLTLPRPLEHVR